MIKWSPEHKRNNVIQYSCNALSQLPKVFGSDSAALDGKARDWKVFFFRSSWDAPWGPYKDPGEVPRKLPSQSRQRHPAHHWQESRGGQCQRVIHETFCQRFSQIHIQAFAQVFSCSSPPLNLSQKVNDSGMDDSPPSPRPETSIQEPGSSGRNIHPKAPVDSMLKDMATIIFSTFLLAGWVAFVITYPKVSLLSTVPPMKLKDWWGGETMYNFVILVYFC